MTRRWQRLSSLLDEITVKGVTAGETLLRITATCTVGGKNYTATAILPVTVKGTSGGG